MVWSGIRERGKKMLDGRFDRNRVSGAVEFNLYCVQLLVRLDGDCLCGGTKMVVQSADDLRFTARRKWRLYCC